MNFRKVICIGEECSGRLVKIRMSGRKRKREKVGVRLTDTHERNLGTKVLHTSRPFRREGKFKGATS